MRRHKRCPQPPQPQQPPQRFHHQTTDDVNYSDSEPNFNNYGPSPTKASADENYSIFLRLLEEERQRILGAQNQIQYQEEEEANEKGARIPSSPLPPLDFHFLEFKGLDGFDPQSCKWRLRPNSSLSQGHVSFLPHITQQQQQLHPHFHVPRTNGSSPVPVHAPYRSPSCHLPPNYNYNYHNVEHDTARERPPFPPVPAYESRHDDGGNRIGGRGWTPQHFKKRGGNKKGKRWKCADAQQDKITDTEMQFNLDRIKVFTETGVGHLHANNKGKRGKNSNLLSLPPLGSLLATCGRVIQPPRFSNLNLPVTANDNDDEHCYGYDYGNSGNVNNVGEYILDPNMNLSAAPQTLGEMKASKKGGKETKRWRMERMAEDQDRYRCWNYGGTERRNSNESVALSWFGRTVKVGKGANNCVRKCGGGGYATGINSHLLLFPHDAPHSNNSASGGLNRNPNQNQKRNSRRRNGNHVGDEVERLAGGAYALKVKSKIDSWWRPKRKY